MPACVRHQAAGEGVEFGVEVVDRGDGGATATAGRLARRRRIAGLTASAISGQSRSCPSAPSEPSKLSAKPMKAQCAGFWRASGAPRCRPGGDVFAERVVEADAVPPRLVLEPRDIRRREAAGEQTGQHIRRGDQ